MRLVTANDAEINGRESEDTLILDYRGRLDKTFTVNVTDETLNLDFLASSNNAMVSAIEIKPSTSTFS